MTSTKPGTPWFPDDGRSIGGGKQAAGLLFKSAARSGSAGITGPDPNVMWREAYYRKMAEDPSLPLELRRGYENLLAEARKAAQESMVPMVSASASSSRRVHIVRDRATGKVTKKTVEADVRKSPPPVAKPQAAGGWGGFGDLSPRSGRQ